MIAKRLRSALIIEYFAILFALICLISGCANITADRAIDAGDSASPEQINITTLTLNSIISIKETWLKALTVNDVYENGLVFENAPSDFLSTFQDNIALLSIPDARKGERAVDIQSAIDSWHNSSVVFLNALPEDNIYLYGFNSSEYPVCGLILDIGEAQTIYSFPFRYMTNRTIAPDIKLNQNSL